MSSTTHAERPGRLTCRLRARPRAHGGGAPEAQDASPALDELEWRLACGGGELQGSWHEVLASWDAAAEALARHPALERWKEAIDCRTATLRRAGEAGDVEPDDFAERCWRQVGLAGDPEHAVHLRGTTGWAELVLGDLEPRALVVAASPAALRGLGAPEEARVLPNGFLLVSPDGAVDARRLR